MISFYRIVRVLVDDMDGRGQELIEDPQVGRRPVSGDLRWSRGTLKCLSEEAMRGCQIPLLGDQHTCRQRNRIANTRPA
jgi:hypothetical protein